MFLHTELPQGHPAPSCSRCSPEHPGHMRAPTPSLDNGRTLSKCTQKQKQHLKQTSGYNQKGARAIASGGLNTQQDVHVSVGKLIYQSKLNTSVSTQNIKTQCWAVKSDKVIAEAEKTGRLFSAASGMNLGQFAGNDHLWLRSLWTKSSQIWKGQEGKMLTYSNMSVQFKPPSSALLALKTSIQISDPTLPFTNFQQS